jgi:hypothetical protein
MKPEIDPTPAAIIADGITKIQKSMDDILAAGLKAKTIITLVHARTGLPQRDIAAVLDSLHALKEDWCS